MPARGKVLVRRVETLETLPGGRIVLTEATREGLTAQQAEIVAVGYPMRCAAFPDCERPHEAAFHAPPGRFSDEPHYHPRPVTVGQWVLLAPRSLVETDEPGLYVVSQDDVLAVLQLPSEESF